MTARVCRVQPDLPALDRAFDYAVPPDLAPLVTEGVLVRVRLHGRSVRGWVVRDDVRAEAPPARLLPLRRVLGAGPPAEVIELCRFVAHRYAGPLALVLRAASPPQLVAPGPVPVWEHGLSPHREPPVPGGAVSAAVKTIEWPPAADRRELVRSLLAASGSTLVLVPEPARAGPLVRALSGVGREVVTWHSGLPDAARAAAWDRARRGAAVVIGGRTAVFAPVPDLAAIVVLDENDEALQEERAPTWHAREVAIERARRTGATVTLVSAAPTVHAAIAAGARVDRPSRAVARAGWPVLEIVDRRAEPPGAGLATEALGAALRRALERGQRAVCVLNRTGRARLLACSACGELARCGSCGAAVAQPAEDLVCPRCATARPRVCLGCGATRLRAVTPGVRGARDTVAGLVPRATVAALDASGTGSGTAALASAHVLVGTEAVLHRAGRQPAVGVVAFLDFDAELLAPRSRANELALGLLARTARLLGPRAADGRLLVQTRVPGHPVLDAVLHADPGRLLDPEIELRRRLGFPPFGGMAEITGAEQAVADAAARLRAVGLDVVGPSAHGALVRAPTAEALADGIAAVDLAPARALGRLRVAVDPPRV